MINSLKGEGAQSGHDAAAILHADRESHMLVGKGRKIHAVGRELATPLESQMISCYTPCQRL